MLENKGDLSGRTLGNCTLERLLGQGGMGAVYLAKQERPSRYVAVKVLHSNLAMGTHGNEEFQARFQREANVIARLEHVNIMPIYEYGEQNGIAFLVMPYVSGGSLKDILVKRGVLSLQEAMNYIDQAASALDYAHSQGVVHRDLKPANFLLHTDGRLVLADFGIARIIEESVATTSALTSVGTVLGTPEYMAPEMAGAGPIDYRADIYELGIVLFQMLTGRVPFSGTTPYAVVIKQIQERIPSVLQSNPSLPPAVDGVIQRATAKIPDDRYQTARAMAQALHQSSTTQAGGYYSSPGVVAPATGNLPGQPLVLPAASPYETPSLILRGQGTGNTGYNMGQTVGYGGAQPGYPGYQTGQYAPPITKKRQPWLIILGIVALLLLLVGGVAFGSQILKGVQGGQSNTPTGQPTIPAGTGVSTPTTAVTPQATPTTIPTPTPILTPTPAQITAPTTIVTGDKLYNTNRPGCDRNKNLWINYNGARITCAGNRTYLTNPDQNQGLEGILLSALPGQGNYPANYVVQARVQPENNSNGDIGIYFRNQPGQANQGVYTFLIHPDGSWSITVYDNNATPTELKKGQTGVDPQGQMDLGVIANGQQFDVYVNNNYLGSVTDGTYPTGTVGLVVGVGATMQVTNFVLSNPAA